MRTDPGAIPEICRPNHGVFRLAGMIDLALGRIHEATGNAADMFAVLVASQRQGTVFWIGNRAGLDTLAPTGLQAFLDPSRLILAIGASRSEVLWAAEQALRVPGAGNVIVELDTGPDLRESRRLQLAAERGGGAGIVLISGRPRNSAAQTRWQCETVDSDEAPWLWRLTKNRRGLAGAWAVNWIPTDRENDGAKGLVHLVPCAAT